MIKDFHCAFPSLVISLSLCSIIIKRFEVATIVKVAIVLMKGYYLRLDSVDSEIKHSKTLILDRSSSMTSQMMLKRGWF